MSPFKPMHIDVPRWALIVICFAPFVMGALGAYAVTAGGERQINNCEAIEGLRNDLVEVVRDGDKRTTEAITDAFEGATRERLLENLRDQTKYTVSKIDDPECP